MQIRRRPPNPAIAVEYLRYQIKADDAAPQNILEEIVWHKETEVDQLREAVPLVELLQTDVDGSACAKFLAALQQSTTQPAVIAEVKKASPSKGVIREDFHPVAIAQAYQQGGATCLSVLTDSKFFQGSFEYLAAIRAATDLPLLCKDFILYPYQMFYARAHGADAVLFIAAILTDQDLPYFIKIARSLNLTVLIEVHTQEELDRVLALEDVNLIGINNRDLQDFSVDVQTTCTLLSKQNQQIRDRQILIVSESGLHTAADLHQVNQAGASAVLMGESLMKQPDPGMALSELLRSLNTLTVTSGANLPSL